MFDNMIKEKLDSTTILLKTYNKDIYVGDISLVLLFLDKETLQDLLKIRQELLELQNKFCEIKDIHLKAYDLIWLEATTDELANIAVELESKEYLGIDAMYLDYKDLEESSHDTAKNSCVISTQGVHWTTFSLDESILFYTSTLSWKSIEKLLQYCDPPSVRFIKHEKE